MRINDITLPYPDKTLYVIGNGFDLMHGVPSTYYNFRNFLGKGSQMRSVLENYLTREDLWADFEESLAHIDSGAMLNVVDDWMRIYGACESGTASGDFHDAVESAVKPAKTIMNGLPAYFRQWVESLRPGGCGRPLEKVLKKEAMYLNFNYTEFLETIYGIPREHILYIHGCRTRKDQELVLGHAPCRADVWSRTKAGGIPRGTKISSGSGRLKITSGHKKPEDPSLIEQAREKAAHYISHYEDAMEKHTEALIYANRDFFLKQANVRDIVIIGHSMASVDEPYFQEIRSRSGSSTDANWHVGWHKEEDRTRARLLIKKLGLEAGQSQLVRV